MGEGAGGDALRLPRLGARLGAPLGALARVLRHRELRRVQLAWTGCIVAEMAHTVALAVTAFRAGGIVGVGVMGLARTLPAAVAGPFLATLADRHRRDLVLSVVLLCRTVLVGAIAVLVLGDGPLGIVYVVAAADAITYSLYWPSHSALLPELAQEPEDLTASNVASTMIENLGTLVGPVVAAVILATADLGWVFVAAAGLLAASAVMLLRLALGADRRRAGKGRSIGDGPGRGLVHELLAGFRTLGRERGPRMIVVLYLAQTLVLGALGVLIVVVSVDLLGGGESGVGLLHGAMGAGGVLGSAAALALVGRRSLGTALGASLVAWGVGVVLVAAWPARPAAFAGLLLVGICNALVDVTALTLLQRTVDDEVLGRVLGVFEGLWWAMLGVGAFGGGQLVEATGIRTTLVVVAALLPTLTVLLAGELVRIDRSAPDPQHVGLVASVPMFTGLPIASLERLGRSLLMMSAARDEVIIRHGDRGDRFYLLLGGEVRVDRPGRSLELGPGEYFGELALLRDEPRSATVTAVTDVRLAVLERDDFLAAVEMNPRGSEAAATVVRARTG